MSLIKELKKSKDNQVNLVEFFELLLPDVKTKYTELMLRVFNNTVENKYKDKIDEAKTALKTLFPEKVNDVDEFSIYNTIIISYLFDVLHDLNLNLESVNKFIDFNERGLIEKNDITTYKTYDDIHSQLLFAEMKVQEKEYEKQIVKIFENEEWLMVKPLTVESSIKYGYNTKWCTAMETNKSYFENYTRDGILIYFINKLTNVKVAVYKKLNENGKILGSSEVTFWNKTDKQIDSFGCGLPGYILDELRNHFEKHNFTNKQVIELMNGTPSNKILNKYNVKDSFQQLNDSEIESGYDEGDYVLDEGDDIMDEVSTTNETGAGVLYNPIGENGNDAGNISSEYFMGYNATNNEINGDESTNTTRSRII